MVMNTPLSRKYPGAEVDVSMISLDVNVTPNTAGVQSDVTVTVTVSVVHVLPG